MSSSHLAAFVGEFSGPEPIDLDPSLVLAALGEMPDPRKKRGVRYPFAHLLVIMVCAAMAGQTKLVFMAEWAAHTARKKLAALGIDAPHATTLGRMMARMEAAELDRLSGAWAQAAVQAEAIALDGKEVRGGNRVHLMAAIDHHTGAVFGQVSVAEKSNEIPYLSTLLDGITDLEGMVVKADALHTQRGSADYIHKRNAHYVFTVKGNQPGLLKQCSSQPWKRVRAGNKTRGSSNGREIERTVKAVSLATGINFPHAAQIAQITRKSRPLGTPKPYISSPQ